MCWGDGFVTNKSIIAANGLSDPNPFFQTLLTKPYLDNVVVSPHYYPPSISTATAGEPGGSVLPSGLKNMLLHLTQLIAWRNSSSAIG